MRPIDADALFINLDGMMEVSPTGYIHGDTVADMISDAPTVEVTPKWTPCSKKLPKRTSLYYVTIRDEKNDIEYTSCMNFCMNLARWEVDVNVIAWMPLPEPYEVNNGNS